MKTSILLFVFVCTFAVTTFGTPKKDQTNAHNYSHPLLELYKKIHAGRPYSMESRHKQTSQFLLSSVEHQGWDGENFSSYQKVDHIYQSGRRSETQHSYRSDLEAGWDVTSRDLYQYEGDRLTSIVSQIKIGQNFQNDYRVVFTYQLINGQYFLKETIDQYWNGGQSGWINDERIALIASNGKLSMGESSSWIDDEWYTYELFFFEEQGDDLYVTYQEPYGQFGQNWKYTERQVHKNYSLSDLYNLFVNEYNLVESGSFLEFAEMMPDYTGQLWTGADWMDDERQITHNVVHWQTGILISKQISGQYFDDEWITSSEVRVSYDDGAKSEMVLLLVDFYEQFDLSPVYAEKFEYDENGLVHFIIQKQVPGDVQETAKLNDLVVTGRLMLQWSGVSTSIENDIVPVVFSLGNAYPNPFNPSTIIPFEAQTAGEISIRVYDMVGRHIATLANGIYPAGSHSVRFDAAGLSSGVYLVRMTAPGLQQISRVTLLK